MQKSYYKILSYKLKHTYDIEGFLDSYRLLLQKAIDIIWENMEWIERRQRNYYIARQEWRRIKKYYYVKRVIPIIPKSREFKRNLRNELLKDWSYTSHYVDSAIKVAYSILNSWSGTTSKAEERESSLGLREDSSGLRRLCTLIGTVELG